MPRLAPVFLLALALALALAPAAVSRAFDAQGVFARAKGSVVIVAGYDSSGKLLRFGSGFAVAEGQVLTVLQTVDKAARVVVKTPDGEPCEVQVANTDSRENLALLQCPLNLPPLDFARGEVQVGQDVAVIGSPMGLELTLSTGVVSAVRAEHDRGLVQITAPLSFGSHGGPLLDASGKVAGVVFGSVGKGQNLNFAISSATALHFLGRPLRPRRQQEQAAEPQQTRQDLEVQKRSDGSIVITQPRGRTQ